MNKKKNSMHILVVAISTAILSTAFVSLSIFPSAAQQVKAADEVNEKKNGQYHVISAEHHNLGSNVASLTTSNDNLNQTKVTELRI
ncbi:MAG: hypothetical protein M3264_08315, partial [Thermoproteota archaeon]|nr:hypothetical protein [Thermoproteota archaeon]